MTQKATSRVEPARPTADAPLPIPVSGAPAVPKVAEAVPEIAARRGLLRLLPVGRDRRLSVDIGTSLVAKGIGLAAPLVITPRASAIWESSGTACGWRSPRSPGWPGSPTWGSATACSPGSVFRRRPRQRSREISSAYATLGVVAFALLAGLALVEPLVPWARVFGVTEPAIAAEASTLALLCFGAFAINVPLSLIQRIQYARAQITQSNAWQAAGALASMAAVLAAIAAGKGPLTVIGCAVLAVPVANLLNTLVYFWRQESTARPRPRLVHRATAVGLLRLGLQFFALSAMSSIALNVDSPLVAHVLGSPSPRTSRSSGSSSRSSRCSSRWSG
ncbi:hypothetical protein NKG94_19885 [Micromonospora sp. M12]